MTFACEDARESPMALLRQIVRRKKEQESMRSREGMVQLQEEVSIMKLELPETAAGQLLCSYLEDLAQRRMESLGKIQEEVKRSDMWTAEAEYNEVKQKLDSILVQVHELKMTPGQRVKKGVRSALRKFPT